MSNKITMALTGPRQPIRVRPSRVSPRATSSPTRLNTPQRGYPTPSPLHNEQIIGGRFQVRKPLGAGGCGQVYTGKDTLTGKPIALKIAADGLERFILCKEGKVLDALANINNPFIVRSYGWGEAEDFAYVAMEYVGGISLFDRISSSDRGSIPLTQALDIITQISHGLEAAADQGIMHRDIKPHNIMIDEFGSPKIIDWGLSQRSGPNGTLAYAAPEQITGLDVDCRADIYSLGIVFYEMLTGNIPFRGIGGWDNTLPVLQAKAKSGQLEISGVTDSVQQLVDKMTTSVKARRHQSYKELRDDIAEIQDEIATLTQQVADFERALDFNMAAPPIAILPKPIDLQADIPTGIIGDTELAIIAEQAGASIAA